MTQDISEVSQSEMPLQEREGLNEGVATEGAQSGAVLPAGVAVLKTLSDQIEEGDYIALFFRDGLDMPMAGLTFIATFPSGEICTVESSANGAAALPAHDERRGEAKLEVMDVRGNKQTVCTLDLAQCKDAVIVRSPKTKVKIPLQPHQQVVPAAITALPLAPLNAPLASRTEPRKVDLQQGWWEANGAWRKAWDWIANRYRLLGQAYAHNKAPAAKALSQAGQPVVAVLGPEAPNKDNLRLGRNNIYRQPILEASKRLGLIPQALCALMDCEAGKITEKLPLLGVDGTQMKDKKGLPRFQTIRERWSANAGNAESGAAGLTQFLASTWLAHVLLPGHYIHEKSVANGWVRQESDAKGNKRWTFVLADGSTTRQPYKKRSDDANVKKCLAMRMDAAWSIHAAADYGASNLKLLAERNFKTNDLSDMDKAKLMYLMHHEGEGAGPLFIDKKLASARGGSESLRKKFNLQLGSSGAQKVEELVEQADGDVEVAYRFWFGNFVDKQFAQVGKYFFKDPVIVSKLSALMVKVGGVEIEIVE